MAVELFDAGKLEYFDALRGSQGGVYYAPYLPASRLRLRREILLEELQALGADASLVERLQSQGGPDTDLVALIDSGVVTQHPLLGPRLVATRDFTGEGIEDSWGHGTMRALLALHSQPTARFLVAKVVGSKPGKRQSLIAAIDWAVKQGAGVIWMALGEYTWWCRGWCSLCRAAARAAEAGCVLIAAPGNRPGEVACPAKARGVVPTVPTPYHLRHTVEYVGRLVRLLRVSTSFEYYNPASKSFSTFQSGRS